MFQKPGPRHDPCGKPLLTSLSFCILFVLRLAVLSLSNVLLSYKFSES